MSQATAGYRAEWVFVGKSSVTFSRARLSSQCSAACSAGATLQRQAKENHAEKTTPVRLRRPELGTATIRKPYRLHRIDHSRLRLYSEKVSEGVTHFFRHSQTGRKT